MNNFLIRVNPLKFPGLKTTSFMLRANRRLKKISKEYDLVHYTNDYTGYGLSRKEVGKPVLATLHHTHSLESQSVAPFLHRGLGNKVKFSVSQSLLRRLERSTLEKADMVVAVSKYTATNASSVYPFLRDKIRIVLNAVDETRFHPDIEPVSFKKRFGLGDKDKIILFIGRISASKGIRFLVEAFAEVVRSNPTAKLVIIGSGSTAEKEAIQQKIAILGIGSSIQMIGRVSSEDLPKAYSASDVVVLPSLVEGFGLVLLEGMATGKPVVSTSVGPTSEIIDDKIDGLLVPRADSHLLAEAISSILLDLSLAERIGKAARKKVEEKFSKKRWIDEMMKVYRELTAI